MEDLKRFENWDRIAARAATKERLRELRENMPPRTSEEAYAQMERNRSLEAAEHPADLPYITP